MVVVNTQYPSAHFPTLSVNMSSWIHLDFAIRDYVLLPIFFVVILTSVLRANLTKIAGTPPPKLPDLGEMKFLTMFSRLANLKQNANILSPESFSSKRCMYLNENEKRGPKGLLLAEPPQQLSAMEKMMQQNQDPSTAMNMVKSQFMFLGIHGSLGYWVSHLFSGFLVAKTPFPLTFKIKGMLQRGVDVVALDTSYVSSLSWYFFIMISSGSLIGLWNYLFTSADDHVESTESGSEMAMMMASGGMMGAGRTPFGGGQQVDIKATLVSERENLQVLNHEFSLENSEIELLEKSWSRKDE